MLDDLALYCVVCGRRSRLRRDSRVGALFGNAYRIDAKLAEGGFCAVYRVTHLPSGFELALKVLHADFAADPKIVARFRQESKVLANLHDPHTVTTFERGELRDGTLFIAMELLRGESLLDRFRRRGALPWREVLTILRGVCRSLAEAHGQGIVHRDLKPGNLHLEPNDLVKVIDFGVAKVHGRTGFDEELTTIGQTVGTLGYMSPEQLVSGECSQRSDIYALGVVAFEMICGRRPFHEANDPASLVTAMMTQPPPWPSSFLELPEMVDRLVLRCLERDPAHRFANIDELTRAIDHALQHPRSPSSPRLARVHRAELGALASPARGSVVDVEPVSESRGIALYALGASIAAVGAAIAWLALS
jgi:eukaryotic-like serine/threonine-protein kinase